MAKQGFPLSITVEDKLVSTVKPSGPVASKLEAWVNFEALKSGWYEDENRVVECDITVLTVEQLAEKMNNQKADDWVIAPDKTSAVYFAPSSFDVYALIPMTQQQVSDFAATSSNFEPWLKFNLLGVVNQIASRYGVRVIEG
jgi:hypothetical protein